MTDDEKAAAVQEALAGVRMCPHCGMSMLRTYLTSDFLGDRVPGWFCNGEPPDLTGSSFRVKNVTHEIYLFDDGTKVRPAAGESSMTFLIERDVDLGIIDGLKDVLNMDWLGKP